MADCKAKLRRTDVDANSEVDVEGGVEEEEEDDAGEGRRECGGSGVGRNGESWLGLEIHNFFTLKKANLEKNNWYGSGRVVDLNLYTMSNVSFW